jgi:ADP-ribose pyrophosphatase YjhB (NUDIX family)
MAKIVSCGIAPLRKNGDEIEILLCKPINGGFYGMGFLKGQVEPDETELEAAKREFDEESGGLDVELFSEEDYFTQNNPKKKIHIWPAKVPQTPKNENKIEADGTVPEHDEENELIKFYPLSDLPHVFRNQQQILDEILSFVEIHKDEII